MPQQRGQKHEKLEPPRAIVCLFLFEGFNKNDPAGFLNNLFQTFGQGTDTRISPRQKGKKIAGPAMRMPSGTTIKRY
jgi:hypothetical protein